MSDSFTAAGDVGATFNLPADHNLSIAISGTFVATVALESQIGPQAWAKVLEINGVETRSIKAEPGPYRLRCSKFTSGTAVCALASAADPDAAVAAAGLAGTKTIVVSTTGDDTAGAASKYTAEFLTIAAALTASASGDTIIVRAGSYAPAGMLTLKTGVGVHFLPGAIVTAAAGSSLFYDGAVAITTSITGHGQFVVNGVANLLETDASSVVHIECEKVSGNTTTSLLIPAGAASTMSLRARSIACAGPVIDAGNTNTTAVIRADTITCGIAVKINGTGPADIAVEATQSITGGQIIDDESSTGATRVSIRAPKIIANHAGNTGFWLAGVGAARYLVEGDEVIGGVRLNAALANAIFNVGTLVSNNGSNRTLDALAGKMWVRAREVRGIAGLDYAVFLRGGTVHLMSGRYIGLDGAAIGHAIAFNDDVSLLRVYPGVVLIAGDDAAAKAIGLAGGAATPTAVLMGAIAANKGADAGVVVAVGSLLVDAAVV